MSDRKDITVPMPQELKDQIDDQLEYGDSRSEWIREAVRQRLGIEEPEGGNGTMRMKAVS